MIVSMTGYGAAGVESDALQASVSVRSLNHRYLDVTLHLSRGIEALEREIKALVESRLGRGRVELAVRAVVPRSEEAVVAARPLVAGLVRTLRQLQAEHGLAGEVDVAQVARFPGALEVADAGLDEEGRSRVLGLVGQALDGLEEMRRAEGAHLARELDRLLSAVEEAAARIEALTEAGKAARRESLVEKVRAVCADAGLEPERVYPEVARLVERADVREELERLRSHVALARRLLEGSGLAGKRLDFLAQELMREANTVGSKAVSAPVVHEVVGLKSEIERFREQVQNVE